MARILVVGREARRVRGFRDRGPDDFLERVDAFSFRGGGVHEMHFGILGMVSFVRVI